MLNDHMSLQRSAAANKRFSVIHTDKKIAEVRQK